MAIEALLAALPDLAGAKALDAPRELLPAPDSGDGTSSPVEPAPAEADAGIVDPYAEAGEHLEPGFTRAA
jgi:hypothetical protein